MLGKMDYVMVVVSDMPKSVAFYRDLLGLTLRMESPGWTEFQTGDTTLALHGGGQPATGQAEGKERAGTCSFGFYVADVDATYEALKSKGVRFAMPPTERTNEGIKLSVCLDPDGLGISIAQSLHAPVQH